MKIQNGKIDAKQSFFFLILLILLSADIHVCMPNFAQLMADRYYNVFTYSFPCILLNIQYIRK
jgi:hypothetical protein